MHINDTQNSNKYLRGTWFCMPDNTNRPKHMQSRRAGLPCLDVSVRPKLLLICTFITNERWLFVWHISNLIHLLNYRVLPVLQWSAPFHYVSVNVDLFTSGKKLQRQPYVDGFDLPSTAVSNTCKRPLWNWTDRPLNYFENFSSVQWVEICLRKKQNSIFKKINLIVYISAIYHPIFFIRYKSIEN